MTGLRPAIGYFVLAMLGIACMPWVSGGQEPLIRFLTVGALLMATVLLWKQDAVRRLKFGPLTWAYGGVVGWTALSLIWSINRYDTVIWLVQLILAGVVFRLAFSLGDNPVWVARFRFMYLISAGIFAAYAMYLYLTGEYDRLTGWFYWANPAAAYLIPAIVFSWQGMRGRKWWLWALAATGFGTAFWLTDSRGGTLVLIGITTLYLLLVSQNRINRIQIVFTLALAFLLSIGLAHLRTNLIHSGHTITPGSRFADAASGESRSVSDRVNYLKSAFSIWYDHPLIGTGGGTFSSIHPAYQRVVVSASTSAHNVYVQTLAEEGIIGASALAGLILVLLFGLLRGVGVSRDKGIIGLAAVALLAHFGLDIDVRYPALLLLAAALLGFAYHQRSGEPIKLSLSSIAGVVFAFIVTLSAYQSSVWMSRGLSVQTDGDYQTASAYFDNAHGGLVYDPDTLNAEGIDYYTEAIFGAKGASALALDRARAAERQDPWDGQHYQLEGRVLVLQKKPVEAANAFSEALRRDPFNHPDYAMDLGLALQNQGKSAEALKVAQDMLSQYTDKVIENRHNDLTLTNNLANLYSLVATIKISQGDMTAAKAAVGKGLKLAPENLRCRAVAHQLGL